MSATTSSSSLASPLALTTIFSQAENCFKGLWLSLTWNTGILTCALPYVQLDTCYPSGAGENDYLATGLFYSPGVCPTGYYLAAKSDVFPSVATKPLAIPDGLNVSTSATAYESICCPPSMVLGESNYCISEVAPTVILASGGKIHTVTAPFVAAVPAMTVQWASTDLSQFTPQSAPLLSGINNTTMPLFGLPSPAASTLLSPNRTLSTTSTAEPFQTSTSTTHPFTSPLSPTPTPTVSTTTNHPLSPGSIAGIAIGSTTTALLLFVLLATLFWRKRRRHRHRRPTENSTGIFAKPELSGEGVERIIPELGLDGHIEELEGGGVVVEADDVGVRCELEGGLGRAEVSGTGLGNSGNFDRIGGSNLSSRGERS